MHVYQSSSISSNSSLMQCYKCVLNNYIGIFDLSNCIDKKEEEEDVKVVAISETKDPTTSDIFRITDNHTVMMINSSNWSNSYECLKSLKPFN